MPRPRKHPVVTVTAYPDPTRLTDEEADYLLRALVNVLRDRVPEQTFFHAFGRGVEYGPGDGNREAAREFMRLLARASV